jgi:hypothetical protein
MTPMGADSPRAENRETSELQAHEQMLEWKGRKGARIDAPRHPYLQR